MGSVRLVKATNRGIDTRSSTTTTNRSAIPRSLQSSPVQSSLCYSVQSSKTVVSRVGSLQQTGHAPTTTWSPHRAPGTPCRAVAAVSLSANLGSKVASRHAPNKRARGEGASGVCVSALSHDGYLRVLQGVPWASAVTAGDYARRNPRRVCLAWFVSETHGYSRSNSAEVGSR